MIETPRTDKACTARMSGYMTGCVDADFARQLEREVNDWRACAAELAEAMRGSSEILRQSALSKFEKLKSNT